MNELRADKSVSSPIKTRGGSVGGCYVLDVLNALIEKPRTARDVHAVTGIGHKTVIACFVKLAAKKLIEPVGHGQKLMTENGKGRGQIPSLWAPARRLRQ